MLRLPFAAVLVVAALALPAGAAAAVAPGRVVYAISATPTREGVDPFAVGAAATLPDGGLVTTGIDGRGHLVLAQMNADGSRDTGFGDAGIATLTVPDDPSLYGPFPSEVLPTPDGAFLVASEGAAPSVNATNVVVLSRVLSDGRLDPAFGSAGSVVTDLQNRGGVELEPDGRILVTGTTGTFGPPDHTGIPTAGDRKWVIERFGADGTPDASFGQNSTTTLPGTEGADVAVLPGGRLAVSSSTDGGDSFLLELLPDGNIDPGFHGGQPLDLGAPTAGGLVARADGAVDVLTSDYRFSYASKVLRVRPDGSLDGTFGSGGAVKVPGTVAGGQLLAAPGGADVLVERLSLNIEPGQPEQVRALRLLPDGAYDAMWGGADGKVLALAFGGGYGTVGAVHHAPLVQPLGGTGFSMASAAVRPDGGLFLTGPVGVIQYTGEGEGFLHEEIAAAAYRPDLSADTSFGGPAQPPAISLALPPQRASTDAVPSHFGVHVLLGASAPGLFRVVVRAGHRAIALALVPVFAAGRQRAPVFLTAYGRKRLLRARHLKVTVTATFRDLLTSRASATVRGTMR